MEEDIYHYGMEFLIDEEERDSIAKVLNSLSVKLRKNSILPDCRFIVTDVHSFFKKIASVFTETQYPKRTTFLLPLDGYRKLPLLICRSRVLLF